MSIYDLKRRKRRAQQLRRKVLWGCVQSIAVSCCLLFVLWKTGLLGRLLEGNWQISAEGLIASTATSEPLPSLAEAPARNDQQASSDPQQPNPGSRLSSPPQDDRSRGTSTPANRRRTADGDNTAADNENAYGEDIRRADEESDNDIGIFRSLLQENQSNAGSDSDAPVEARWELVFDFETGVSTIEIEPEADLDSLAVVDVVGCELTDSTLPQLKVGTTTLQLAESQLDVRLVLSEATATTPARVVMRVYAQNARGGDILFRSRNAAEAILAQRKAVSKLAAQLAGLTAEQNQLVNWLKAKVAKKLAARNAAKAQVDTLNQAIATTRANLIGEQNLLAVYEQAEQYGKSLDGKMRIKLDQRLTKVR
ncbi:hypothetical protein SH139x_002360 [Planctomycetaceae bacterium SH139]